MNLELFMPHPEQRVRLENISSVQGNIILCEILKTNLCGKLRNNNRCKILRRLFVGHFQKIIINFY